MISLSSFEIRSDVLIEHVFAYMVRDKYGFVAVTIMNPREKDTFEIYKKVLDSFEYIYRWIMKKRCAELVQIIREDNLGSLLFTIANEYFSEEITWGHIAIYFNFIEELALACIYKKLPKSIVNVIFESFSEIAKQKLKSWIEKNGNWEGIRLVKRKSTLQSVKFWVTYFLLTYLLLRIVIKVFGNVISSIVYSIINFQ